MTNPLDKQRTTVIYGQEATTNKILQFIGNADKGWDNCIDKEGPSVSIRTKIIRKAVEHAKNEKGLRIRSITEITRDNIEYCKEYIKIVTELRHLDGIKGNFGVSEKEYLSTSRLQEASLLSEIIYSNVKSIVDQHQFLFETLWSKAVPAEIKIREIEQDLEPVFVDVIQNSKRAKEVYLHLLDIATKEIMIIFPTLYAFIRQEKIGVIQAIKDAVKYRNTKARLLMPLKYFADDAMWYVISDNERLLQSLQQRKPSPSPTQQSNVQEKSLKHKENNNRIMSIDDLLYENVEIRNIEGTSETKATILIVDKKLSLVMELRDDLKNTFEEAIGLSTYSNSSPGVLSYISIFESLWKISELYEQIKSHDKMQKEFINATSHELRTPTQVILGCSGILKEHPERIEEIVDLIYNNATRLQRLINNILDVTKIESHLLILHKKQFDLGEIISSMVEEYRKQIKQDGRDIELIYDQQYDVSSNNQIFVYADKERIIQVISNLLENAIKFTKIGFISITYDFKKYDDTNYDGNGDSDIIGNVVVKIKDTGIGINKEIFPKLFTKFTSDSFQGTGLGLYISKNIIEAHGGNIGVQKNKENGEGVTFYFSLPLSKDCEFDVKQNNNYKENQGLKQER
ncbi:MAG TPA: HAMP domain-containing sensor histidine kinase [Bacillus sp. (in: firmicutes)]|nr:HAMP domain-containing sensor histidine kinase [Bacillus sp. (in: firmicutes)]